MVEMHRPVMEQEVLQFLVYREDGVYVDATLGDGGHAGAICQKLSPAGRLIGIDWDEAAQERARPRLEGFAGQVLLVRDSYTRLPEILAQAGVLGVHGILIDLGASTLQLMDADRGFSYHREGVLDMRMDQRAAQTAQDIVNNCTADELADIFFRYGEERWSRRIAGAVVRERDREGEINDSERLAEIVRQAIPARYRRRGGHPSRKVFQALRLAVNRELENIDIVLPLALGSLLPGGRLVVISYHSLEDRLVKNFFRQESGICSCPPRRPCLCTEGGALKVLAPGAVKPSASEVEQNPRARSARLRAAERR